MKHLSIPPDVSLLLDRMQRHGFEAYVVGGCVRDACMGRKPHDWDITTNAGPQETMKIMEGFPVITTGLKHGTVTVVVHRVGYEITTYRVDGEYSDGRHPDQVVFVKNLSEDLARRDFTINAMAYNPKAGLVDLFEGQEDIERKQIRCVGVARERFTEDVLRILRALRFAAVFEYAIEEETDQAIHALKESLPRVSMERITTELRKMIQGRGFVKIARSYVDVLGEVIPELLPMVGFDHKSPWHHLDVWEHTLRACEEVGSLEADEITRWAVFFHDIGKPGVCVEKEGVRHFKKHVVLGARMTDEILKRMKFDTRSRTLIVELVLHHDDLLRPSKKTVRHLLSGLGEEQLRRLLVLRRADCIAHRPSLVPQMLRDWEENCRYMDQILSEEGVITLKELALTGNDLRRMGILPGKTYGLYLKELLWLVLEEELPNEKSALEAKVRQWEEKKG